ALGLDYLYSHTLNTVGVARVLSGDAERGVAELTEGIALAEEQGAVEAVRGHVNLGSVLSFLGRPEESRRHHERGLVIAREFGHVYSTIFLLAECARDRY